MTTNQNQEAINHWKLALRYRPTEIMPYFNLGKLLFHNGENKNALEFLYRGCLISVSARKLIKSQMILDLMTRIDPEHKSTLWASKEVKNLNLTFVMYT